MAPVDASIKIALGAEIFKSAAGTVSVLELNEIESAVPGVKQEDTGNNVLCIKRLRLSRKETTNFKNMPSVGFCYNLF